MLNLHYEIKPNYKHLKRNIMKKEEIKIQAKIAAKAMLSLIENPEGANGTEMCRNLAKSLWDANPDEERRIINAGKDLGIDPIDLVYLYFWQIASDALLEASKEKFNRILAIIIRQFPNK